MFLLLLLLQLTLIALPGHATGFIPRRIFSNADEKKSFLSLQDRSLISALNTIAPDLRKTAASDSDSYASTSQVKNVSPTGSNGNVSKHQGKYGTTRHLKQIFFGRCYEYQYRKGVIEEDEWDCNALWDMFYNAFAFKGPCDVTSEDYKAFLNAIDEKVEVDKGLLWSGTRELAHKYSDFLYTKKFTTLEDTLAGYLLHGLTWCGHPTSGINFNECPWSCSLQSSYWSLANTRFAQKLRGVVHMILNGTRMHLDDGRKYPTYMKDRYYLGPNVIPVLKKENIKKIILIVAHTLHLQPLEFCGMMSVKVLEDEITKKGIPVECHNDPNATRHIFCASDPDAKECSRVLTKNGEDADIGQLLPYLSSASALLPARL